MGNQLLPMICCLLIGPSRKSRYCDRNSSNKFNQIPVNSAQPFFQRDHKIFKKASHKFNYHNSKHSYSIHLNEPTQGFIFFFLIFVTGTEKKTRFVIVIDICQCTRYTSSFTNKTYFVRIFAILSLLGKVWNSAVLVSLEHASQYASQFLRKVAVKSGILGCKKHKKQPAKSWKY